MDQENLTLTVAEAAVKLRIHEDTLYMMVKRKEIPHFRLGQRIFFKSKTLDSWIENMERNSTLKN